MQKILQEARGEHGALRTADGVRQMQEVPQAMHVMPDIGSAQVLSAILLWWNLVGAQAQTIAEQQNADSDCSKT